VGTEERLKKTFFVGEKGIDGLLFSGFKSVIGRNSTSIHMEIRIEIASWISSGLAHGIRGRGIQTSLLCKR
jgi:hypothetical protein